MYKQGNQEEGQDNTESTSTFFLNYQKCNVTNITILFFIDVFPEANTKYLLFHIVI